MAESSGVEKLGLERLLAPRGVDEFFASYFQRRPLLIQGRDPSIYADLLSLDQVEHLIDTDEGTGGKCRLIGGDEAVKRRVVEKSGELDDVLVAYGRGASINLAGLDRRSTAVGALRDRLRADFAGRGVPLTEHGDSVVFITPTDSQALKPHVDPDDLFVMQLEGRKHWKVFAHDPHWRQDLPGELPPPAIEAELEPGDLLYIPQHWIHVAGAGAEFSFALTMGIRPAAWFDVLGAVLARMFGVSPLFEALPPGMVADGRLTPAGRERARALLGELAASPALERALGEAELRLGRAAGARRGRIASVNRARRLDGDTVCALARPARVERHGDSAEISAEGRRVKAPASAAPALAWIADQDAAFPVRAIGGGLSESAKVVLARRLVLEGILAIAAA